MPVAKPDRRTERTRASLLTAFRKLVLSEGYAPLTVERIAEAANVGRSTFYMHFKSKDAILRQSISGPSSHLAIIVGRDVTVDSVSPILSHFYDQRRVNHVFFEAPARTLWVKRLAELIEPRIAAVSRHVRGRPVLPLPLMALQIAEMQIGLITHWLTSKSPVKPEIIAEALIAATRASLSSLLRCKPETPLCIPGERLRLVEV